MSEQPKKAHSSATRDITNATGEQTNLPHIGNALALSGLIGLGITNPSASIQGLVSLLDATSNDTVNLSYVTAGLKILAAVGEKSGFSWISGPTGIALEIVGMVERAQNNKEACRVIAIRVFRTIRAITQRDSANIEQPVLELERELRKVLETVRRLSSQNKFRQTVHGGDIEKQVIECDKLLDECISLFSLKAHIGHAADMEHVKAEIGDVKTIVQRLEIESKMNFFPRANLQISSTAPPPPSIFVGRDDLVSKGVNHLTTTVGAHSAILGLGGIGKTSLSLVIFHQNTVTEFFSDKRFFVPCEIFRSGLDLVQAILQILGVSILSKEQDLKTTLFQQLNSFNRCLLLLDGFETLSNDTTSISILEMISSIPSVSLLVTMRGEFPPSSVSWDFLLPSNGLGPLPHNFAKEMYLRQQSHLVDMNKQSMDLLDSLLIELDCVPLAVFILSELGKRYTLQVLQQRWKKNKTKLLKMPGTINTKMTNIGISIDLSLNSHFLTTHPEALRLLYLLASLPEGLANWSNFLPLITPGFDDVYDALDIVCQAALVQRTDYLLSMLNPIREYILESKNNIYETIKNDLKAILHFINKCVQQNLEVLALFGKTNIAHLFLIYMNDYNDAETIIHEGISCAEYFYNHHIYTTTLIDILVEKIKLLGLNKLLARCYMHKSRILYALNDWQNATTECILAYNAYLVDENKLGMAESLILLGDNYKMQTEYEKAIEKHSAAYDIFSELDSQVKMAHSILLMGDDLRMLDKYEEALEKHNAAYLSYQKNNDKLGMAYSLKSLGDDLMMQNKYIEASSKLEEAYIFFSKTQNKSGMANSLDSMGNSLKMQAKYKNAIEKYNHSYEIFQDLNNKLGMANSLMSVGEILRLQEKYTEAFERLDAADEVFTQIKYQPGKAASLKSSGHTLIMQSKYSEAIKNLEAAYDIFYKIKDQLGIAQSLDLIGDCLRMQDKYDKAIEKHDAAYTIYRQIHDDNGMAKCLKSLGDNLRIQGKYLEAFTKDSAAFEIYKKIEYQPGIAATLQSLGNDLRYQNKYQEAIQKYQNAYDIFIKIEDTLGTANALDCLGDAYKMSNNIGEAIKKHESAYELYSKLQFQLGIAKSLRSLGDNFKIQQKYNKAIEKHNDALKIYELIKDDLGVANSLKSLGDDFKLQEKYSEAIQKLIAAYKIFQQIQDLLGMANCQISLGDVYNLEENYDAAFDKHAKALEIYNKIGYKLGIANALKSCGDIFYKEKKYDEAILKHNESYDIYKNIGDKSGMANSLKSLRDNFQRQGNELEAKKKQSAAYIIYAELLREAGIEPIDSLGNDLIMQHLL